MTLQVGSPPSPVPKALAPHVQPAQGSAQCAHSVAGGKSLTHVREPGGPQGLDFAKPSRMISRSVRRARRTNRGGRGACKGRDMPHSLFPCPRLLGPVVGFSAALLMGACGEGSARRDDDVTASCANLPPSIPRRWDLT